MKKLFVIALFLCSSNALAVVPDGSITTAKIVDANVTTAKLANASVTQAKRAALGQQVSASCGSFVNNTANYVDVTNLSVAIVATGRPIFLGIIGDASGSSSYGYFRFLRDGVVVSTVGVGSLGVQHFAVDVGAIAGSHVYKVQIAGYDGGYGLAGHATNLKLIAYEL